MFKMDVLQVLVAVFTGYILYRIVQRYRYRKILQKIPSPPGHWLIGNLEFVLKNPTPGEIFTFLRNCAEKYRPIYRMSAPHIVTINILHPEDIEIVLSQMIHISKSTIYTFLQNWLGEGLLTSTGLKWQTRRKLLTRAFHFNILQKFIKVFNEETENLVNQIQKINVSLQEGESISILPIITQMTLQSMTETTMGISNIEQNTLEEYRHNIYKMGSFLLLRVTKPWTRISFLHSLSKDGRAEKATIKTLHEFTYRVIREREKNMLNENYKNLRSTSYSGKKIMKMLDLLLDEKINEDSIDYEGIREEVDTFMFEGHDTTSAAIAFLIYTLAQHPNIQEKVRNEINDNIANDEVPTYEDLQKLSYTERVIKETLRLYPSVPFISRISGENFVTRSGYFIPKGTILHMHIFDLHRDPEFYPDPLKFDPDRFLIENCNKRHPFAYLPFSAGPRNCIGQKFAMLEIKAAISGILRKFQLREDPTSKVTFLTDLILRPEGDIKVVFVPIKR